MMPAVHTDPSPYGVLTEPTTLVMQRSLPGPVERVWSYIIDSELRRQWLAAGPLNPEPDATFELVWRNDELSASPSERPEGFPAESRAVCTVIAVTPMRSLTFDWPGAGVVTLALEPVGDEVVLTVTHRQLPDRRRIVMVGAGWHMHCDILAARMAGRSAGSFWSGWSQLRAEYDRRLAA